MQQKEGVNAKMLYWDRSVWERKKKNTCEMLKHLEAVNLSIGVHRGNFCDTEIKLSLWGQILYTADIPVRF